MRGYQAMQILILKPILKFAWMIAWCCVLFGITIPLAAEEKFTGTTMGPIRYNVTVTQMPDAQSHESIQKAIDGTLGRVNQLMSTYIDTSDVTRFNRAAKNQWVDVDAETVQVVKRAGEISRLTNGAFDITVGPLVKRWNFGPGKKDEFKLPSQSEIDELLKRIGYDKIGIRENPPALRKQVDGLQIDLSAIAKGYAVDQVANTLADLKCDAFLVEVGGEVRGRGTKPDGSPWIVGIRNPKRNANLPWAAQVKLVDKAMATSGDYENYFVIDGQRYNHTIDPVSGWPVKHQLASASIVAADCMTADAFATAALVIGPESKEQAKNWDVEIYNLIRKTNNGQESFERKISVGFPSVGNGQTKNPGFNTVILFAVGVFVIAIAGMAIGVIVSNRRIKGSCGGIASLQESQGESVSCSMCSNPSDQCKELKEAVQRKRQAEQP